MSMIVIMPGGFHPFHAGHFALYQSAKKAFPGAEVYVAATNDMSERPFPFELKEKLAKLAGVEPGHFVQVKSPFQSKEITQHYDPNKDVLVFVRSEKDRNESPKPGGTKKDGTPAYFQPWTGKNLQPFAKHAYFAYLPTVEFGPGITSATQIRKAWPTLDDRRKTAMVMSLYPAAQKNPKLAQNVVGMFDQVMGGQVDEGWKQKAAAAALAGTMAASPAHAGFAGDLAGAAAYGLGQGVVSGLVGPKLFAKKNKRDLEFAEQIPDEVDKARYLKAFKSIKHSRNMSVGDPVFMGANAVDEIQFNKVKKALAEKYNIELNKEVKETKSEKEDLFIAGDPESDKLLRYAQQHYPSAPTKQHAFIKFVQRALSHSEEEDKMQDVEIENLRQEISQLKNLVKSQVSESTDYLDEK